MAAFVFRKAPEALPEVKFQDATGKERTLADWRGKVVLLNLWATWCLPCRKEMPALDRLQKEMGSDKFEVVAVSVDRKGLEASQEVPRRDGGQNAWRSTPTRRARMSSTLRAVGLPATLLLDAQGREIGRLLGPAEWDSEDAKRLITRCSSEHVRLADQARERDSGIEHRLARFGIGCSRPPTMERASCSAMQRWPVSFRCRLSEVR